jgi:hypothetical protein
VSISLTPLELCESFIYLMFTSGESLHVYVSSHHAAMEMPEIGTMLMFTSGESLDLDFSLTKLLTPPEA